MLLKVDNSNFPHVAFRRRSANDKKPAAARGHEAGDNPADVDAADSLPSIPFGAGFCVYLRIEPVDAAISCCNKKPAVERASGRGKAVSVVARQDRSLAPLLGFRIENIDQLLNG